MKVGKENFFSQVTQTHAVIAAVSKFQGTYWEGSQLAGYMISKKGPVRGGGGTGINFGSSISSSVSLS